MKSLIISGAAAAVIGVLAFFAAVTVTFVPGVAALYPATAFEAAFGAWFGIWGAIASYLGLLIAGTAGGWFSLPLGMLLSISDFLMALAPAIAVRVFKLDPELTNFKSKFYFVFGTLIFGSLPGSLIYNYINLYIGQIAGWNTFWFSVGGWNLGNLIMLGLIGVPLMRYGTSIIRQVDLFMKSMM